MLCSYCGEISTVMELGEYMTRYDITQDNQTGGRMYPGVDYMPRDYLSAKPDRLPGTNPGSVAVCPHCGRAVLLRSVNNKLSKYGTGYYDGRVTTWYKSAKDPVNALVAVTVDGMLSKGYTDDTLLTSPWSMYRAHVAQVSVIIYGQGGTRFTRHAWQIWSQSYDCTWQRNMQCLSASGGQEVSGDVVSWNMAIRGTRFAWLRDFDLHYDPQRVSVTARAAAFPGAEYLHKRGWHDVVRVYLMRGIHHLKTNAKSIPAILGVSPAYWQQIKAQKLILNTDDLSILQTICKADVPPAKGIRLWETFIGTPAVARRRENGHNYSYIITRFATELDGTGIDKGKALSYCLRRGVPVDMYTDYIRQLHEMDALNPEDAQVVYPSDFPAAHDRTAERYRTCLEQIRARQRLVEAEIKADGQKAHIPAMAATWAIYSPRADFDHGKFAFRLFREPREVCREGAMQDNCVASYITSYAEGRTLIGTLRLRETPDIPRYTVEINPKTGDIIQCRGYKNDREIEQREAKAAEQGEIDAFWAAWTVNWKRKAKAKPIDLRQADTQRKGA